MDESKYEVAFEVIVAAGSSKAAAMEAIEAAREFRFDDAKLSLQKADEAMLEAHQLQTELMQGEARGTPVDVNIILVHAQDHLTMAIMAKEQAEELLALYGMMQQLTKKLEGLA